MKIWLDDLRTPPDDSWTWIKTADEAIELIGLNDPHIWEVSLDNDLGEDQKEGRKVVLWMAENNVWPTKVNVHTDNPVAREYMLGMIDRYKPD